MKRNTSATPSIVLRAFAPETPYTLSLDGCLLLEALDSPFLTGGTPGLRDTLLAALVMTDTDAVERARRTGSLDDLVSQAAKGRKPSELLAKTDQITAAIREAFAPADAGDATSPDEKKSSPAAAGG